MTTDALRFTRRITDHRSLITLLLLTSLLLPLQGFPPSPYHKIYGLVRDQFGEPFNGRAVIILETDQGVAVQSELIPGRAPGVNYEIRVPMDAGLSLDTYRPNALLPAMPFKVKVKVGSTTYLPIEMLGDFQYLGQPGKETRLDLTLGEDSDGDGLPDAWERRLIAQGHGKTLEDIRPGDDSDRDGLSNRGEYIAGTYAYDPANGFALTIKRLHEGRPVLEFTGVGNRTYTVQASADLSQWSTVRIRVNGGSEARDSFSATEASPIEAEVENPPAGLSFYRLIVR